MPYLPAGFAYPSIDPVLFRVGPVAVRWYGLAYVAAFLLGHLALKRMIRVGRLRLSTDQLSDLVSWLLPGLLLGGRLGWWLFYHRSEGAAEPWYEPLAIWHGGMSFHGGLVGVAIALCAWSRRNQGAILNLADCIALVAPIGLFLGRLANFINAELVGRPTKLPWGIVFPGETMARHPSQLYEAGLEGPVLLLCLCLASRRKRLRDGQTAALFLICYSLFRFAVEFTRQPDEQIGFIAFGWLTMGQLMSAGLLIAGVLWVMVVAVRAGSNLRHLPGAANQG